MCILLVEDEELIRDIMSESLREAGFDVVSAASGPEALALFDARPHHFSLLVTDFHMPGQMDGSMVAEQIRRQAPSLPVVIVSGRPEVFRSSWRTNLNYALLAKPYRPRDLVELAQTLMR